MSIDLEAIRKKALAEYRKKQTIANEMRTLVQDFEELIFKEFLSVTQIDRIEKDDE